VPLLTVSKLAKGGGGEAPPKLVLSSLQSYRTKFITLPLRIEQWINVCVCKWLYIIIKKYYVKDEFNE
jgi:hypothetical protein